MADLKQGQNYGAAVYGALLLGALSVGVVGCQLSGDTLTIVQGEPAESTEVRASTATDTDAPYQPPVGNQCQQDEDCDDLRSCTEDRCAEGYCVHRVACGDGNSCTTDVCDEQTGACRSSRQNCDNPGGGGLGCCDDGNACTADSYSDEVCGCVHPPVTCEDGDACTTNACDPALGCQYTDLDCSDFSQDRCNVGQCDPEVGGCFVQTLADGFTCGEAQACIAGACETATGLAAQLPFVDVGGFLMGQINPPGNAPPPEQDGAMDILGTAISEDDPDIPLGLVWSARLGPFPPAEAEEPREYSPNSAQHQTYHIGSEVAAYGRVGLLVNSETRSYFMFDATGVRRASKASLRLWMFQQSSNAFSPNWRGDTPHGDASVLRSGEIPALPSYGSPDPGEDYVLYRVGIEPEHIWDSPYQAAVDANSPQNSGMVLEYGQHNGDIYLQLGGEKVPTGSASGVGGRVGYRRFTPKDSAADGDTPLIPNPRLAGTVAASTVDCTDPAAPCGRWIDIPLNQAALDWINSTEGTIVMGAALTSLRRWRPAGSTQWLFPYHYSDLRDSTLELVFPADVALGLPEVRRYESYASDGFAAPLPQLVVENDYCFADADCNGGNLCSGLVCDLNTLSCKQGEAVHCDAVDACHQASSCEPTTGECTAQQPVECAGTGCQVASCDATLGCQLSNLVEGALCGAADQGLTCNATGQCVADCTAETVATDCPPNACQTDPQCVAGQCQYTARSVDDGLYCNGVEACDPVTGAVLPGAAVACEQNGVYCDGEEVCDEVTRLCVSVNACEDGLFCTGVETCDEVAETCTVTAPCLRSCQEGVCVERTAERQGSCEFAAEPNFSACEQDAAQGVCRYGFCANKTQYLMYVGNHPVMIDDLGGGEGTGAGGYIRYSLGDSGEAGCGTGGVAGLDGTPYIVDVSTTYASVEVLSPTGRSARSQYTVVVGTGEDATTTERTSQVRLQGGLRAAFGTGTVQAMVSPQLVLAATATNQANASLFRWLLPPDPSLGGEQLLEADVQTVPALENAGRSRRIHSMAVQDGRVILRTVTVATAGIEEGLTDASFEVNALTGELGPMQVEPNPVVPCGKWQGAPAGTGSMYYGGQVGLDTWLVLSEQALNDDPSDDAAPPCVSRVRAGQQLLDADWRVDNLRELVGGRPAGDFTLLSEEVALIWAFHSELVDASLPATSVAGRQNVYLPYLWRINEATAERIEGARPRSGLALKVFYAGQRVFLFSEANENRLNRFDEVLESGVIRPAFEIDEGDSNGGRLCGSANGAAGQIIQVY